MMKFTNIIYIIVLLFSCSEPPIQLSKDALNQSFIITESTSITFKDIISKYPNQNIVIDVWATWCRDCIEGLPELKALQKAHPEAAYVFLSVDKKQEVWKKGIKHYDVKGDHYFFPNGWKGAFTDFIDLDWIPRYMVVDAQGNIKLFKVIKADDQKLQDILK